MLSQFLFLFTVQLVVAFEMIEVTLGNDFQGMVIPMLLAKFSSRMQLTNWSTTVWFADLSSEWKLSLRKHFEASSTVSQLITVSLVVGQI